MQACVAQLDNESCYTRNLKENIKKDLENSLEDNPDTGGSRSMGGGFNSKSFREGN